MRTLTRLQRRKYFFGTAARSSFGQLNTQKGFSYSDALRSGTETPLQSNLGNAQQIQAQSQSTLESMMVTMQQSMTIQMVRPTVEPAP